MRRESRSRQDIQSAKRLAISIRQVTAVDGDRRLSRAIEILLTTADLHTDVARKDSNNENVKKISRTSIKDGLPIRPAEMPEMSEQEVDDENRRAC